LPKPRLEERHIAGGEEGPPELGLRRRHRAGCPAVGSAVRGVVVGEMGMGVGHKDARGKR
jgi:hypothetical protein